jgi:hypothetical protein
LVQVLTRAVVAAVDALAERLIDAMTARRPTDPGAPPPAAARPNPRLRPVRKPRDHHVWASYDDDGVIVSPPPCVNCDVDQTETNRFAPCPGRSVARYW